MPRSDPPFFCGGAVVAQCDSLRIHDFVIRTNSSVVFPTLLRRREHPFLYLVSPVCSSFSTKGCAILHTPGWSREHQQARHFSSQTLALFLLYFPLICSSFFLTLSGRYYPGSFFSIRLQRVQGHLFFMCNDTADMLAKQSALLHPSILQILVVSLFLLLPLVFYHLFSRSEDILSHQNF